jgi:hypothetical protein
LLAVDKPGEASTESKGEYALTSVKGTIVDSDNNGTPDAIHTDSGALHWAVMQDWTGYLNDEGRAVWEYSLAGVSGEVQAAFWEYALWTYSGVATNSIQVYDYAGNGSVSTSDWYNNTHLLTTVPFSPDPYNPVLFDATTAIQQRIADANTHAGFLFMGSPRNGTQGVYTDESASAMRGLFIVTRDPAGTPGQMAAAIEIRWYTMDGLGWIIKNNSGSGQYIESITVNLATVPGSPSFTTNYSDFFTIPAFETTTGLTAPPNDANQADSDVPNGATSFTMTFTDFAPGESFYFMIGVGSNLRGNELAGTTFTVNFTGGTLAGQTAVSGTFNSALTLAGPAGPTAPLVTATNPVGGSTLTSSSVNLDVSFSEAVVGVDATDMVLSGTAASGASVGTPVDLGGDVWRFPLSGLSDGALDISLAPDPDDIEDADGNDLSPRPTQWSYIVAIPQGAPVLAPEPPVTPGTSNTVSWSAVPGAAEYFAEVDDDPGFGSPNSNSGWIPGLSHLFINLGDGQTYYYHVKARTSVSATDGSWIQDSQADFDSGNTLSNVSTAASPGSVVLASGTGGSGSRNIFLYAVPVGLGLKLDFVSDLENMGHLVTHSQSFPANPAVYDVIIILGSTPAVSLANVSSAALDNYVAGGGGLIVFEDAIQDGIVATAAASCPVSAFTGWPLRTGTSMVNAGSPLASGLAATSALSGYSFQPTLKAGADTVIRWTDDSVPMAVTYAHGGGRTVFFNDLWAWYSSSQIPSWYGAHSYGYTLMSNAINYVTSSGYVSSGTCISAPITPSPFLEWNTVSFAKTTPAGTTLTVDILPASGSTPIPGYANIASGTDLSGLAQTTIRLRANLATTNAAVTPSLDLWTVTWQAAPEYAESAFSNVEWSQQDATPPTANITLDDPTPTDADAVHFSVVFSESVGSTFTAADIVVTGTLAGTALVSGSDPNYTVTVTLSDPDADGTVGINVGTGVNDAAGNACAGASSPLYTIANWPGFAAEPQDARKYTGDAHTFEVQIAPGPDAPAYQWKWEDGSKAVQDGPAASTWTLTGLNAGHRGLYWCEVTYGGVTYPSQQATLLVEDHLQITPLADQTLQAGGSCTFSVTASGGYAPITYTWRKDSITIDTATGPSYTRADLTGDDSGTYAVEVLDGNGDVQTASATLTVLEGVPAAGLTGAACLLGLIGLFGAVRMKSR